jgi:deoxyribodipyrimidine photo-lyase
MNRITFIPTRTEGLRRLAAFAPKAGRAYASGRNTDHGPGQRQAVSILSPYIRHRLVTEREVVCAALAHHSEDAAEKFIQEVFWRSYFKGHLETRPAIWARYLAARDNQLSAIAKGGGLAKAYRQATEGRTGIDCFDAWVTELAETGYLHNHARMWFASIWIFTLKLPWELGADFTYRHFIDGDPASNTLSWRWVGGLHTKGKTYLARPDNIAAHSNGRFSPRGLAREALALEEAALPAASPLPVALSTLPAGRMGLLLTEEDMNPESLISEAPGGLSAEIVAIAGASCVQERSPQPVPAFVSGFCEAALDEALLRSSAHFKAPSERLASLSAITVIDFARKHQITTLLCPYAPVGPAAAALQEMAPALAKAGVQLMQLRRPWDTLTWPKSTRGFFALKEQIAGFLKSLGPESLGHENQKDSGAQFSFVL